MTGVWDVLPFFVAKWHGFVAKCKILSEEIVILYRNQKRKYYDRQNTYI